MSNAKVAVEQIHAIVRLRPVRDSRRLRQTGQVATERAVNKGNCCRVPQSEQAIVIATRRMPNLSQGNPFALSA
jgi:hypothetical protein